MRANRRWVQIAILSSVIVIGVLTIASSLLSDTDAPPKAGETAPGFTLRGLDGQAYSLDDFQGKHLILNFWGSFCEPCVDEMPLLQQYHDEYQEQGLIVLGLNLNEPEVTVRGFVKDYGVHFPILLDKDHVRKQYGVFSYPTTFFIDKHGTIRDIYVGRLPEHYLMRQVHLLLSI